MNTVSVYSDCFTLLLSGPTADAGDNPAALLAGDDAVPDLTPTAPRADESDAPPGLSDGPPSLSTEIPAAIAGDGLRQKFDVLFGEPAQFRSYFYGSPNGGGEPSQTQKAGSPVVPACHVATTLKLGDHGTGVRALQHDLNKWRAAQTPAQPSIAEDGRFTATTKAAVEDFQRASRMGTGGRTGAATPDGVADAAVQDRLRLENDPTFKKLSQRGQAAAREILSLGDCSRRDALFALLDSPKFATLKKPPQDAMLKGLLMRGVEGNPRALSDAALVNEYLKLANNPKFGELESGIQAAVVNQVSMFARHPHTAKSGEGSRDTIAAAANLTGVATSDGFGKLELQDQRFVLGLVAGRSDDKQFVTALTSLLKSPPFIGLEQDVKTAVLSQIKNYPDYRSVQYVERMLSKEWFSDQSFGDKQRSLKTIACLAQYDGGDRVIIENTLDNLVSPESDLRLGWTDRKVSGTTPDGENAVLLSRHIPAGDEDAPTDRYSREIVFSAVAHEVNHWLNDDKAEGAEGTFHHFEFEYRAWTVGFRAEHGRWPNNSEALERVQYMLEEVEAYSDMAHMRTSVDQQMLNRFLAGITGVPVGSASLHDYLSALNSDRNGWREADDPAQAQDRSTRQPDRTAPIPAGHLDNHPSWQQYPWGKVELQHAHRR